MTDRDEQIARLRQRIDDLEERVELLQGELLRMDELEEEVEGNSKFIATNDDRLQSLEAENE